MLRRALTNRDRGPQAWAFVAQRFADLSDRLPSNTVARMLEGVRTFTDPALAREVESFVAEHPVPQAARLVAQHLERMRTNVALAERTRGDLGTALTPGAWGDGHRSRVYGRAYVRAPHGRGPAPRSALLGPSTAVHSKVAPGSSMRTGSPGHVTSTSSRENWSPSTSIMSAMTRSTTSTA